MAPEGRPLLATDSDCPGRGRPYGARMTDKDRFDDPSLDATDRRIIELVAHGLTNRTIAEHLHLSHQTVRNRITRIFDVTGVSNRTQLAVAWLRLNA